jgi:hypothetical protein
MTPVLQSCFIGLLAMVIASVMACRSESIPVSALAPEFSVRGQPSLPIFSADVDVSISAVTLAEAPGSPPAQRLTYHIERSRNAKGEWRTLYTDVVLPADRLSSTAGPQPHVTRFEMDDAGRMTGFDGAGNAIDRQFPRIPDSLRGKESISRDALSRLQASLAIGSDADAGVSGIRRFFLDKRKHHAIIARLEANGKRVAARFHRTVYEVASGNGTLRLTADDSLGAIIESERHPANGPVTRVASDFAEVSPGRWVRVHSHMEREGLRNAPALTVDTRLANVIVAQEVK